MSSSRIPLAFTVACLVVGLVHGPRSAAEEPFSLRVNTAIDRGVDALRKAQNEDGSFGGKRFPEQHYQLGYTAFTVYALLRSGVPPEDPAIQKALAFIRKQEVAKTYDATALILALHALMDESDKPRIQKAAEWLVANAHQAEHVWAYPTGPTRDYEKTDLSNTQFAALGLWVAERSGYVAPTAIWTEVARAVLPYQRPDGGFRYSLNRGDVYSTTGMTTAGITILTLASDRIDSGERRHRLGRDIRDALKAAWGFMDRRFRGDGNAVGGHLWTRLYHEYALYGVERVAVLAGRKSIGGKDWYRDGAAALMANQGVDGGWGGHLGDTCLALLFLKRATVTYMPEKAETQSDEARAPQGQDPTPTLKAPDATRPSGETPALRSWLILGPFDHGGDAPPDAKPPFAESPVRPREKGRTAGLVWTAHYSEKDRIDVTGVVGRRDNSLSYAFTWIHLDTESDVVLWLAHDDAARMWIDGEVVYDEPILHNHQEFTQPVRLRLAPGFHRLLLRHEEWAWGSAFELKLVGLDGTPVKGARASLEPK